MSRDALQKTRTTTLTKRRAAKKLPARASAPKKASASRGRRPKYQMTISRMTVDKLGVKLYDKVAAVMAELVANSYDADAREVTITAPMGELLATKVKGGFKDRGYKILIKDDGLGMTPTQVNEFYLKVGAERRKDPRRGEVSKKFGRKVMGNKGVGKLAPFGICQKIEVLTSGGDLTAGTDEHGRSAEGYLTAHLILDRDKILSPVDKPYAPDIGELDGIVRPQTGTLITLSLFSNRWVPPINNFERQLAQKFGLSTPNWKIILCDSQKKKGNPDFSRRVGAFSVDTMDNTKIRFVAETGPDAKEVHKAYAPDGNILPDVQAGFYFEEDFYPVTGWVAYAKKNYRDDLMAGIRIYCRGKIAAQTPIFGRKSGFTGEYDIRSYLVGELHADWLDEGEDLIQTDRKDILWSSELGEAFEEWGQKIVGRIGKLSRDPLKVKTWEHFLDVTKIGERVKKAFPGKGQEEIRKNAMEFAKVFGQKIRQDELKDEPSLDNFVQLSLFLAPHITLDEKLREAAESKDSPLEAVTAIMKTARLAELASFGTIADKRVKVIETVEKLKDDKKTLESTFQDLITNAPWLIDPQWSPLTANQSFATLRSEFAKYYKEETGQDLEFENFTDPRKRADFVLDNQHNVLQIVEIKKPGHSLRNEEMERIDNYIKYMREFLGNEAHKDFAARFPRFQVTLVCDKLGLKGVYDSAFQGYRNDGTLSWINWTAFLLRTRRVHEEFLAEAERQRQNAAKED